MLWLALVDRAARRSAPRRDRVTIQPVRASDRWVVGIVPRIEHENARPARSLAPRSRSRRSRHAALRAAVVLFLALVVLDLVRQRVIRGSGGMATAQAQAMSAGAGA